MRGRVAGPIGGVLDELALYVALKGFEFQVLHPPELAPVLLALSDRLRRAADAS